MSNFMKIEKNGLITSTYTTGACIAAPNEYIAIDKFDKNLHLAFYKGKTIYKVVLTQINSTNHFTLEALNQEGILSVDDIFTVKVYFVESIEDKEIEAFAGSMQVEINKGIGSFHIKVPSAGRYLVKIENRDNIDFIEWKGYLYADS